MQIKLQNKAAEKCGERIKGAASKQITEGGTSYTTGQNRQRQGRIGEPLDILQDPEGLFHTVFPGSYFAGELVDSGDPSKMYGRIGKMFELSGVLYSIFHTICEDGVGNHINVKGVCVKGFCHPLHRLLDTGYFRSVHQERFSHGERELQNAVVVAHDRSVSVPRVSFAQEIFYQLQKTGLTFPHSVCLRTVLKNACKSEAWDYLVCVSYRQPMSLEIQPCCLRVQSCFLFFRCIRFCLRISLPMNSSMP